MIHGEVSSGLWNSGVGGVVCTSVFHAIKCTDTPGDVMKELTLHIEGMSCGHCLNAVNKALAGLPGVETITVRIGRADLRFDEGQSDPVRIAQAVSAAGYRATPAPTP